MNEATDQLNASLSGAEEAIANLNLGVTAGVVMEQDPQGWEELLTFGKDKQAWRLLFESGPEPGDPEYWSSTPLVKASRAIRLKAVNFLVPLVEKLISTANEEVENIRAQTKTVQDLTAKLRESGTGEDIPF